MTTTVEAEEAIRSYLQSLEDPSALVDANRVAALEEAVRSAADPIKKLKALAELERARIPDTARYEQQFIRHAKAWAAANDVTPASFEALGVPSGVLRSAGLVTRPTRGAATSRSRRSTRKSSVSAHDITAGIMARKPGVFTLADVATTIGGSPMTIRKAVEELVRSGRIERLGPTPKWSGRGRAPLQFRKK